MDVLFKINLDVFRDIEKMKNINLLYATLAIQILKERYEIIPIFYLLGHQKMLTHSYVRNSNQNQRAL